MFRSMIPSLWHGRDAAPAGRQRDPFFALQDKVGRAFDDVFRGFTDGEFSAFKNMELSPSIDIAETDDMLEIDVELPGVDEKDLSIDLVDNLLTIKGEKKFEKREDKSRKGYHLVERSYGSFARTVALPYLVEADAIEAVFKNGVLKITAPRPIEMIEKTKHIPISVR